MIIFDILIAFFCCFFCFFILFYSYMCKDFTQNICFPWFWSSTKISYIWFNIGWFFLLFSMDSIQLWEFVYINLFLWIFFKAIFIAVISVISSGRTPLLVISVNIAAKSTIFPMLFNLCVCVSFFWIFMFFLCCKKYYFSYCHY